MRTYFPDIDSISRTIVARKFPLFTDDISLMENNLFESYRDKRIIFLGGAGFIATETIIQVLKYQPKYLAIVDISETAIADLVRYLRTNNLINSNVTIDFYLADITDNSLNLALNAIGEVDIVFNFAAAKHVRSERNVPSIIRMFDINFLCLSNLYNCIENISPDCKVFTISTDKAADPSNLMGLSKKLMEIKSYSLFANLTSARFANVLFSSGAITANWLSSIQFRKPIISPSKVARFFITPEESGQLCLLGVVAAHGNVIIPAPGVLTSTDFEQVAKEFLKSLNFQPMSIPVEDYSQNYWNSNIVEGKYPYVLTNANTEGEKSEEVMKSIHERVISWTKNISRIKIDTYNDQIKEFEDFVLHIKKNSQEAYTKDMIVNKAKKAIPNFFYLESAHKLDDRI